MKDLEDLLDTLAKASAGMTLEEFKTAILAELPRRHPGEKIYIKAPDTTKKQMVMDAARRLPTGVVAQRCGVHASYVRKLIRRKP